MGSQEIKNKLKQLLQTEFKINPNVLTPLNDDVPLASMTFRFMVYDFVYLFFAVEDTFHIKINLEEINIRFNTINNITKIIEDYQLQAC